MKTHVSDRTPGQIAPSPEVEDETKNCGPVEKRETVLTGLIQRDSMEELGPELGHVLLPSSERITTFSCLGQ